MKASNKYYIEVLMAEFAIDDHLSIAALFINRNENQLPQQPIAMNMLSGIRIGISMLMFYKTLFNLSESTLPLSNTFKYLSTGDYSYFHFLNEIKTIIFCAIMNVNESFKKHILTLVVVHPLTFVAHI